jgi:hypothetical protein
MRTLTLSFVLALGCSGASKPSASGPIENSSTAPAATGSASAPIECTAHATCEPCIDTGCHWDYGATSCSKSCDTTTCLVVGTTNIGAARAHEVCAGVTSPTK